MSRTFRELDADRVERGVCRHCGGDVPCWSPYGDVLVGVKWNARERERTRRLDGFSSEKWLGTRETGVMPNTAEGLVDRGWLERAHEKGGRRLVYRLTEKGARARVNGLR